MTLEVFVAIAGVVIFTVVFMASAMYFQRGADLVPARQPAPAKAEAPPATSVYSQHD